MPETPHHPENEEIATDTVEFLTLMTQYQTALRGYIQGAVWDYHDVHDVLQNTNAVLWRKEEQWNRDVPFLKWAFAVAKYEILAYRRDQAREKLVFNDEVLDLVLEDSEELAPQLSERSEALSTCVAKLSESHKRLLSYKYVSRQRIDEISNQVGKSEDSVRSLLKRLRGKLRDCINLQLRTAS